MTLSRGVFLVLGAAFVFQPAHAESLAMDTPTMVGGIETVCTGVSLDARQDPRWSAYSLKVEIAGEGGKYLGSEAVTLRKDGKLLSEFDCGGPWVLFKLPQGRYDVQARIGGQTASSAAFVPSEGQGRIILRFAGSE